MADPIDEIIEFLQDSVGDALKEARQNASRIHNGGLVPLGNASLEYKASIPALKEPPVFSDMFTGVDNTSAELRRLDAETEKWFDKYWPEINGCLRDKPEQWLCKILSGSDPFGDSRAVVDALWHEARDRAYRASATEQRTISAVFDSRGFTLPPGVAVRLAVESEQRATQAIAEVNRTQTGEMLKLKMDLLKFAEEQAIKIKLGVMSELRGFYATWVSIPDKDIERQRIRAQAQAQLYSALSSYYNVQLGFEGLRLRAAEADLEAKLGVDRNKIAAYSSNRSADALANVVRGFTDVASSSANAQSALVVSMAD